MLPIDLADLFLKEIKAAKRPNDGLLHASTDLAGSLRHSQLRLADAPTNERVIASEIRLQHGTLWHEWFRNTLEKHGIPVFNEVGLADYMPQGWSGTADWVFWHPDYKAFVLGDLKTVRGEAMYWIEREGAKYEHMWQLSAYYYALLDMGLPMVKGFSILYWPMNDTPDKEIILPSVQECEPISKDLVVKEMTTRYERCIEYLNSTTGYGPVTNVRVAYDHPDIGAKLSDWITPTLAPPMEREQKATWSKVSKTFEVKLVPHWSSRFCPYSDELCDCNQQGTTKVGQYAHRGDSWVYEARSGYEDVRPTVEPSNAEKLRRRKELG